MRMKSLLKYKYQILWWVLIWTTLLFLFIVFFKNSNQLNIEDYTSMSDRYISELQSKISNIKEPIILSDSELRWKLNYIDSLYNDWLINASESTYYLPSKDCKSPCLSVRETYLFNLNFPLYEW